MIVIHDSSTEKDPLKKPHRDGRFLIRAANNRSSEVFAMLSLILVIPLKRICNFFHSDEGNMKWKHLSVSCLCKSVYPEWDRHFCINTSF